MKTAASVNSVGGVLVGEINGTLVLIRNTKAIGEWSNRDELRNAFSKAAKKLGWKSDKRCKYGWRKVDR